MNDLMKAKECLGNNEYTCVLCRGDDLHTSALRGVKPLVIWLESDVDFQNYSAGDKVIGKATAFLYVLLGVKAVYAKVISKSALEVLLEHNIDVEYDLLVENIVNRQGDGICPFESAVLYITDKHNAYRVILNKMKELNLL